MNAYAKMQMLIGVNPCAAQTPDMVDDTDAMMEIIHESRENSAFIQFLRQNDDINYVYMKMRDTNYSIQNIKDTHQRFNQNENESVMQTWDKIYTLSKIGASMFVNFDNIENLFFLSENQVLIGMDFINFSQKHDDMNAVFNRMKQTIDLCFPELPFMPELIPLPELPQLPQLPELPDLPELFLAPNAPVRLQGLPIHRDNIIPRQLFM
jgi:hypothetical protein